MYPKLWLTTYMSNLSISLVVGKYFLFFPYTLDTLSIYYIQVKFEISSKNENYFLNKILKNLHVSNNFCVCKRNPA